jgi:hypothetical protein
MSYEENKRREDVDGDEWLAPRSGRLYHWKMGPFCLNLCGGRAILDEVAKK